MIIIKNIFKGFISIFFTGSLLTLMQPCVFLDSAESWQIGFQDPASPIMRGIVELHHDLFFFLLVVLGFVFWLLFQVVWAFNSTKGHVVVKEIQYGAVLEVVWTVVPAILLVFVAIPSFTLLYSMDEIVDPMLTVKVIGHQWYWSYEYSDYVVENLKTDTSFIFDSYIITEDDLKLGQLRLLEVDKRVVLPICTHVRVVVTAADVLHSWAVPSLGLKIDACPGRLNQASVFIDRPGVYYGQCSEICGINHGFMPIVIEAVKFKDYSSWIFIKYIEETLLNEDEVVETLNFHVQNFLSNNRIPIVENTELLTLDDFVRNIKPIEDGGSFYKKFLKAFK